MTSPGLKSLGSNFPFVVCPSFIFIINPFSHATRIISSLTLEIPLSFQLLLRFVTMEYILSPSFTKWESSPVADTLSIVSDSESLLIESFCSVVTFLGFFFFHEFKVLDTGSHKEKPKRIAIYHLFLCNFCLMFSPRVVMELVFTVVSTFWWGVLCFLLWLFFPFLSPWLFSLWGTLFFFHFPCWGLSYSCLPGLESL